MKKSIVILTFLLLAVTYGYGDNNVNSNNPAIAIVHAGKIIVFDTSLKKRKEIWSGEHPSISPDGTTIAYREAEHDKYICLRSLLDPNIPITIMGEGSNPKWNTKGTMLACKSGEKVNIVDIKNNPPRVVWSIHGEEPRWINNEQLLFLDGDNLYRGDVSKKTRTLILSAVIAFCPSRDGSKVYVALTTGVVPSDIGVSIPINEVNKPFGKTKLISIDLSTKRQKTIWEKNLMPLRGTGYIMEVESSPKDDKIAFVTEDGHGWLTINGHSVAKIEGTIHVYILATRKEQVVAEKIENLLSIAWVPDNKRILASRVREIQCKVIYKGKPGVIRLGAEGLRPDIINSLGLDKSILDYDDLFLFSRLKNRWTKKLLSSGHSISVIGQ